MTWSLNEIEALSRKATRGAGYSWGLAEDAGRAVRWLCARRLPGAAALAHLLAWRDGLGASSLVPVIDGDGVRGDADGICPVMAGTLLSDGEIGGDGSLFLVDVVSPLLLVPFASWTAGNAGSAVALSWDGCIVALTPDGALSCDVLPSPTQRADVQLTIGGECPGRVVTAGFRAAVEDATIETLGAFAERTYAPATEESRESGAGAGLSDND